MSKSNQVNYEYRALGVMSGSSLDGLDLCMARFSVNGTWEYEIEKCETVDIPNYLFSQLLNADSLPSLQLLALDVQYGKWIGGTIDKWIPNKNQVDIIGVHGHTVFHEPDQKISLQVGSGLQISISTGLPVVDQFRTKDLLLGGQGAPLVPFGESLLFSGITNFVNLGGIANVSMLGKKMMAWDVAPCNQVLNYLANQLGKPYDSDGEMSRQGSQDLEWNNWLNSIEYFSKRPPKSLSNQWTQNVLQNLPSNTFDALHTYVIFLAKEISKALNDSEGSILVTGGGAYNGHLIERIRFYLSDSSRIVESDSTIVEYKEALIFAFLGLARFRNQPNVLSAVTGAKRDSISGVLHLPN